MALSTRNIFDFTSLISNGEKLLVKKIAIHFIGTGSLQVITSNGEYEVILNEEYYADYANPVIDGFQVQRIVYNRVMTEIHALPNDGSHIIRVATESNSLRLLDVEAIVSSTTLEAGEMKIAPYIPGEGGEPGVVIPGSTDDEDGEPGVVIPGLTDDEDTEEYTYDFGVS